MKPPPCVVDRWQIDSKTERSLCCVLAKATCGINVVTITVFVLKVYENRFQPIGVAKGKGKGRLSAPPN